MKHAVAAMPLLVGLVLLGPAAASEPVAPATPNLLLDVSAALIDLATRKPIDRTEPIQDVILESPVTGMGRTLGAVHGELVPDPYRGAIDIVTEGCTYSQTVSAQSKVYVYTEGTTPLAARWRLLIDAEGLRAEPGPGFARPSVRLRYITDRYGSTESFTAQFARHVFMQTKADAENEITVKTIAQAREKLGAELYPQMVSASEKLSTGLQTFRDVGLSLQGMRFSSSPAFLEAALTVATPHTVAPTSVPALPTDADVGVRIHQSLLNELIRTLLSRKVYRLEPLQKQAETVLDKVFGPAEASTESLVKKLFESVVAKESVITFPDEPASIRIFDDGFEMSAIVANVRVGDVVLPASRASVRYRLEKTPQGTRVMRQGRAEFKSIDPLPSDKTIQATALLLYPLVEALLNDVFRERLDIGALPVPDSSARLAAARVEASRGWLTVTWTRPH